MVNPTDVPLVPLVAYQDAIVSGAICRHGLPPARLDCTRAVDGQVPSGLDAHEGRVPSEAASESSSEVKRSGYWNTEINYPLTSTGF